MTEAEADPGFVTGAVRPGLGILAVLCLLSAPTSGCGGRPSARPLAGPAEARAIGDADAPEPAIRIDRPIRLRPAVGGSLPAAPGDRDDAEAPASGTYHLMRRGDTLYSIARARGVPLAALMKVNGITDPTRVPAGTAILIPRSATEARRGPGLGRPVPAPDPALPPSGQSARPATMDLAWPLGGPVTRTYGTRGNRASHSGIDIDGHLGQTVRAAAAGEVIEAGHDGKYGRVVVIDHGQGFSTLYAHASRLLVRTGERVQRNDPIAEVGRSGNARGTHLHFELRRDGRPLDPLPLLRSGILPASKDR